jgi:MFS family permease
MEVARSHDVAPTLLPLGIASLGAILFFAAMHTIGIALPLYISTGGGSATTIGLVASATSVASLLSRFFAGSLVAGRGNHRVLLLGGVIFLCAPLLYWLANGSIPLLLTAALVQGFGFSLLTTAHLSFIADLAPIRYRGTYLGVAGLAMPFSLAIFPLVSNRLIETMGFQSVFVFAATAAATSLCIFVLLFVKRPLVSGIVVTKTLGWRELLSGPAVFSQIAAVTALGVVDGALLSFLPVLAVSRGLTSFAIFFTIFAVGLVVVQSATGRLVDSLDARRLLLPAFVTLGLSLMVLSTTSTLSGLVTSAILASVGFGAAYVSLIAQVVSIAPPGQSGRASGLFFAAFDFGRILGLLILGVIATYLGYAAIMVLTAMYGLITAVISTRQVQRSP